MIFKKPIISDFLLWIAQAKHVHQVWRAESWQDCEFRDGVQWSSADIALFEDKSIDPLTINRIFPIINLILGNHSNNQLDIIAKGRTQMDGEISQVMSEAIAFVMDQCHGYHLVGNAFEDQVVPGFGCLEVGYNQDPRREKVTVRKMPWYSTYFDPFAGPWMNTDTCRFVFYSDWKDVDQVCYHYADKAKDIRQHVDELAGDGQNYLDHYDISDEIEQYKSAIAGQAWAHANRKRIRPVQMWYTTTEKTWFACMPDGAVHEIDSTNPDNDAFALVEASRQCIAAHVKKMRVATILGSMILSDEPTPYGHNEFPFVPFIGYTDRFGFPFGVPRQIKEQSVETNKRRSTALALLNARRITMERNTAQDPNKIYEEANKMDGLVIVEDGKIGSLDIQEMSELAPAQMEMLQQSEREIQEISGANDESLGYKTTAMSGTALENKKQQSALMISPLMENLRRSKRMLGERIIALIQGAWTAPKVLRITDRVTGAEKWVTVNEQYRNASSGQIEVRNAIAQGRFDIVVSEKPQTDTFREKNMDLLFSAIQKSPPEAVPVLINMALELSDIPSKSETMEQLRIALGVEQIDPSLSSDEQEALKQEQARQREERAQKEARFNDEERIAEIDKTRAEVEEILAKVRALGNKTRLEQEKIDLDGYQKGFEAQMAKMNGAKDGKADRKPTGAIKKMSKTLKDRVEQATEAKIEKHFQSQPELPPKRNFRMWNHDHDLEADRRYRSNFDRIFPNAPGAGL